MFVNLTPHAVHILDENNKVLISCPATGLVARAKEEVVPVMQVHLDGELAYNDELPIVQVSKVSFGKPFIEDVSVAGDVQPWALRQDNVYIVSRIFLSAVRECMDREWADVRFVTPGEAVRDEAGRIIGCRGLYV